MENGTVLSVFLKKVMDENLGMIIVFDDEGEIIYLNEAMKKEVEYAQGEADIRKIFVSLIPEDMSIPEFMEQKGCETAETVVYRKNNTCFSAIVRGSRIEGDSVYNVFSVLNTQYETYAQQELAKVDNSIKEAMKARNEFVANITHELRTPLNGIKGHVRDLEGKEEDAGRKRTMGIILKCCENMEHIISNLLDFSKIEAGKFEINESPFDFRESIQHVVDTSIGIANEKGLKLSAYIAPDIPDMVIGDELRVVQVLNNLVSNALKFTSIGYVNIEVYKTRLKHGRMELTFFVIDSGIGISLENQEKLFQSFSQADGSITRRYGGTGLGLFVTKQLVELMHGSISLQSEVGKGSTFTFTIEVGVEDNGEPELEQTAPAISQFLDTGGAFMPEMQNQDEIFVYGSTENRRELQSNLEKLMLSIEMGSWEKAENFSDNIKQLASDAEQSVKSSIFKMQMAVRKEDYEKSIAQMNQVKTQMGF